MTQFFNFEILSRIIIRTITSSVLMAFAWPLLAQEAKDCRIEEVMFIGLKRTDERWMTRYLKLEAPLSCDKVDTESMRLKVMTTEIFSQASVRLADAVDETKTCSKACKAIIEVQEKWTTIPVIRGVYGGGTPLVILGGYETNAFGRMVSLGGEARRFGNRPPGLFLFAKAPKAFSGHSNLGAEYWLERRRRAFFNEDTSVLGYADSEASTTRLRWLVPIDKSMFKTLMDKPSHTSEMTPWSVGLHVDVHRESPTVFVDRDLRETKPPGDVTITSENETTTVVMPMLVYDSISVDKLEMQGQRVLAKAGKQFSKVEAKTAQEFEFFLYHRLTSTTNLAAHGLYGMQGSDSLRNLYFLGGFDTVRGVPDGMRYGTVLSVINTEMRQSMSIGRYLDAQGALFADHGMAGRKQSDYWHSRETTVGVGVRLSVPQIYRLLLRVDYGWSVGSTKAKGLSVGLGQFFQPYKLTY